MIYLDIEVIQQDPYDWMIRPAADLKPPKNYKDPEKIAEWVREAVASQEADLRERSSLEPLLGGVVACVGVAVGDAEPRVLVNETSDETGERALLGKLEAGLFAGDREAMPLVSWNGAYDWSYLAKRAIRHGLYRLAGRLHVQKPWGDAKHIDPAMAWLGPQRPGEALWRLDAVARYLGIESDDAISGTQVSALWSTERETVIHHCAEDIRRLREVTLRFVAAGWIRATLEEREIPIPPPRGSAADLARRALDLQMQQSPDKVTTAWATAEPSSPLPSDLASVPTDPLRAYLVALGGRP